jgi:hypothetical protein
MGNGSYFSRLYQGQQSYDNQCPDEPEEKECTECDGLMGRYKVGPDDGWVCNKCGNEEVDPEGDDND